MPGLLPKRRAQHDIKRADEKLLKKHQAYLEAWLRAAEQPSGAKRERDGVSKRAAERPQKSRN
jgi:hypothetical protein